MNNQDNKTGFYSAILFLVWPFLSLCSAFWNYKSRWGKNILWAFVAFYGFVFAIGAENQGADIVRYAVEVEELHRAKMTASDAVDYFLASGQVDFFETILNITLSRVTDSQAVVTLVYGIIFGFFFSRNMWFILERLKGKIRLITVLVFVCFFLVVPIWNMNGFRFWTATHIFVYGALPYLFDGKKSRVIVASLSVIVHFAFIVPVGVLYGYMFWGNRLMLYFGFFVLTFFMSEINLTIFNDIIESYAPEIIQERTAGYRSEAVVEQHRGGGGSGKVWYAKYYGVALRWAVKGFLIILFLKGQAFFKKNRGWLNLYCFTLLFYGTAELFTSIPSGSRYLAVANLLALGLIVLYVQNREQRGQVAMKRFIIATTPLLLLYVVVSVRMGLYSMSASALLGNPITAIFMTGDFISLNDVLKGIL
jgi:hypothetical protein